MPFDLSISATEVLRGWRLDDPRWLCGKFPAELLPYIREINEDGYRDRFILITRDELAAWHTAALPTAFEGPYSYPGWRRVLEPKIEKLEELLGARPGRTILRFFLVKWAEWESGLD